MSAPEFSVRRMLHEVLIVPESKPANELLPSCAPGQTKMAMVVDEFGSILGLVTGGRSRTPRR